MAGLSSKKIRLAYFVSHPIQYQVPLLRQLTQGRDMELKVFFASDFSTRGYRDAGFKREIQWDTPLTDGLDFKFLSHAPAAAINRVWGGGIEKLLRDGNFDAVWVHGWAYPWSLRAIRAARRLGLPVLFRCEFNPRHYPPPGFSGKIKMAYLRWLFQRVDAFLSIGTLNREFYLKAGVPPQHIFQVPYAVDNAQFADAYATGRQLRNELLSSAGVPLDTPVLLYVAKFSEVKRPGDLVEAWRRLLGNGRRTFLLWVGEGVLRAEIEGQCRALAPELVHFAGFRNQSELPAYYAASDMLVLPSAVEPWGLVVNEAMSAGLPVITTTAAGCAPDLVQVGLNGQVVSVGDIAALASAIEWCVDHRIEASQASRDIIGRWTYRECESGIMDALRAVLPATKSSVIPT
jgi:glycosyltransferase involved in cell wall biosynthesis